MLQAFGLSYTPDPKGGPLFENLDLHVDRGEKVALVGRNGAGKSVLLDILAGNRAADTGQVILANRVVVAHLRQDFRLDFEGSLRDLLEEEAGEVPAYVVFRTLDRLGLANEFLDRDYGTLSLGERMRAALAVVLAKEPTVLLLDEPTNHLDIEAREWLEQFLADCSEAVLFACHDRRLIDRVADRVLLLDARGLKSYTGGYEEMTATRDADRARQMESWERHRAEDRRLRNAAERVKQIANDVTKLPSHGKTFTKGAMGFYSAREAAVDKRAKAILSRVQKARGEAPVKPHAGDEIALVFPAKPLRSELPVTVRGLSKTFDGRPALEDFDLTLTRGSRLALLGPNGSGKTTVFRLLLGEIEPDEGEIVFGGDVKIATLTQARSALDVDLPALNALHPINAEAENFARLALARLGMRRDLALRRVGDLSVGERSKVEIVSMLLTGANVLFLDEPTNHLDIESLEALESALAEFPGAVLFTSHDRAFVERVATEVIQL